MGLIDRFKDLINVPDDDIYDDDFGFEENADQQDISSSRENLRVRCVRKCLPQRFRQSADNL